MRSTSVTPSEVLSLIQTVRGVEVMLDADLAMLFETDVRTLATCVDLHPELFPDDFVFPLDAGELAALPPGSVVDDRPRRRVLAFTEHGVAHLLCLIDNDRRVPTTVEVLRGFALRRRLLTPAY